MNTVARPATALPGSLVARDAGSTAASYWIGPSTESSGARWRTSSVASRTLLDSAPDPEVPVEYDSIAIRGSTPNCAAVAPTQRRCRPAAPRRVRVDGAVPVDQHPVGQAHEEDAETTGRPAGS